ncbi:MAG TPA: RNA polymerase factor sigma-32 [Myxococcaceae bacterium]|nr:RNA polymerase factor sigma-32 [Myxococcaceae bacterium]
MARSKARTKPAPSDRKPKRARPKAKAARPASASQRAPSEAEAAEVRPEDFGDEAAEALVPPRADSTALARRESRALETRDPLQLYMAEVHRHSLLSRDEEHALAQKYQSTGDLKAAYRLVASNLRLVVKIANEYHRNPLSLLDLIQEGNIGLMQAVKKYDPNRGVKLSSYAAWWIRAYILRYIMDNWRLVKLGTTEAQRKLFFKLRQEQDRLTSQGFEASPKLLAERLNVTEQDVVEMDQRLGHDDVSLDAPVGEVGTATRGERFLSAEGVPADIRLGNEELKRLFRDKLAEFAKGLQDKERFIFEKRLMADEPLTLQQIGDNYGISRERARQIEANLISRIREHVRKEIPDFDLVATEKS